MGSLELLSDTELSLAQKDAVRIGKVCGDQLLVLVNDILDLRFVILLFNCDHREVLFDTYICLPYRYSKMEENKLELESSPFLLREAMEDSMEIVSYEADKKSLELICHLDLGLQHAEIVGDSRRLRQILVNLLNNAVKFSSRGEILLTATTSVSDEGNPTILFCVQGKDLL